MNAKQREEFKKLLLALHAELTEKTPARIEPNRTDDARIGGDEVPLGRLRAMPYAELCVTCQGGKDNPKGRHTRRKLTDYT